MVPELGTANGEVASESRVEAGGNPEPPGKGWRPCPATGQVWTDPNQVLRFVCATHRRQLVALHAAGLADRIRWGRPGLPVGRAAG